MQLHLRALSGPSDKPSSGDGPREVPAAKVGDRETRAPRAARGRSRRLIATGRVRPSVDRNLSSGASVNVDAEPYRRLYRRLRLSTWRRRGDPTRHAIQQTVDPFAVLESRQVAGDDRARRGKFGKMLSHFRYRNAGLLGKFRVESLTVLLEAIQDFGHGGHRVGGGRHCNRPGSEAAIQSSARPDEPA